MVETVQALESAADRLSTVEQALSGCAVSAHAFGADDTGGVPGRVGRQLHELWTAVLEARTQEVGKLTTRLTELADEVGTTARTYEETDDETARRIRRFDRGD